MAANQRKMLVHDLKPGMFVSDLDRPWCETPFPLQGFPIKTQEDINALQTYCKHVFIDMATSDLKREAFESHAVGGFSAPTVSKSSKGNVIKLPPLRVKRPQQYETVTPLKKEVAKAEKLHEKIVESIHQVMQRVVAGEPLEVKETEAVAGDMADSVIRNPDAMVWLSRVHAKDDHAYHHVISASVWALVFGRRLGLERGLLKTLAMGVLLSHIGKAKLRDGLLQKREALTADEYAEYKGYVDHGVAILQDMPAISRQVVTIVQSHRERHNGTGFPAGLTGDRIPLLAKIAGIVDYYQELIEPRPGVAPLTSAQAVSQLYELRNIEFQEDLVERFIQSIGIYPTGTLVELNNEEVGIVLTHNPERRLLPKVLVVLDADKQPLKKTRVIDLMNLSEAEGQPQLVIRNSLPMGAYQIDVRNYQVTGASSRWSLRHLAG